ncbi:MAG: fasciclin domain-containing protein [Reichenbachiella sp.]|uniref:fasciclin domain-containing protein n=1 Tax=Reichenbachiella sp. TaxID=2184521 RepID=UPI00329926F8
MKKNILYLLGMLFLTVGMVACDDDDPNDDVMADAEGSDIVELAVATSTGDNPEFTVLVAALTRSANEGADLISTLKSDGPFTVFAPTDAAFLELLGVIGQTSLDDIPIDVLEEVLKYHVISGAAVYSADITAGDSPATVQGEALELATDGGVTINGATVVADLIDIEGTNGVIHTINSVLVPSTVGKFVNTVLEPAYFNNNFSTLVSAVAENNLVDAILGYDNITIFAPTNEAFAAADLTNVDVSATLLYHVVGATAFAADVPSLDGSVASLETTELFFSTPSAGGVYINGTTKVTAADVVSVEGETDKVVHVIDQVLTIPTGTVVDIAVAASEADPGAEFTLLVKALSESKERGADLIATLSGAGPFTVFAPTDAAFTTFANDNDIDLDAVDITTLENILKHHVASGAVFSVDLADAVDESNQIASLNGNLTFDLTNLTITDGNGGTSGLVSTSLNITGTNGVIHVIDAVLEP